MSSNSDLKGKNSTTLELGDSGPDVMNNSKVRQWCHLFQERSMNIHDKECSRHSTGIVDDSWKKLSSGILVLLDYG